MPRLTPSRRLAHLLSGGLLAGVLGLAPAAQEVIINTDPRAASGISAPAQGTEAGGYATEEEADAAQERTRGGAARRERDPYAGLPDRFRTALEQRDLERVKPRGKVVPKQALPWLAPNGEQLVAVVEQRYLTKPQLAARVDLLLRAQPRPTNATEAEDQRIIAENRLLQQWVEITALSTDATHKGYSVTEQEVDAALRDMAAQRDADGGAGDQQARLRAIGFPEEQLRQEVRDGILVEKLVKDTVKQSFSEAELRKIYQRNPFYFMPPAKAQVWQLVRPRVGPMRKADLEAAAAELDDWRGRVRRAKDPAALQALKAEVAKSRKPGEVGAMQLQDLDWVFNTSPLPEPVLDAIFTLKPGETSEVIESRVGLHIVKVLAKEDPGKRKFEEVREAVEASLFEKTREALASSLRGQYSIHMAASGLNKWVPKPAAPAAAGAAAAGAGVPNRAADAAATTATALATAQQVTTASAAAWLAEAPTTGTAGAAAADATQAAAPGAPGASPAQRFEMPPPPPPEIRAAAGGTGAAPAAVRTKGQRYGNPPPVADVIARQKPAAPVKP